MGFVYDKDIIGYINIFENISDVKVKDCYKSDDSLVFIINPKYMSKAIGKNGSNVKKASRLLRKSIKVIEYDPDVLKFIKNIIHPIYGKIYKESEGIVAIKLDASKDKGIVIGRDKKNLNKMQKIVSIYFNVKVKVI